MTLIWSKGIDTSTCVSPSSGHVTDTSTDSPTDLVLICKKTNSISNVDNCSTSLISVHALIIFLIAVINSACSPVSLQLIEFSLLLREKV